MGDTKVRRRFLQVTVETSEWSMGNAEWERVLHFVIPQKAAGEGRMGGDRSEPHDITNEIQASVEC